MSIHGDSYYDEHDGTEAMRALLDELAVTERRLLEDRMRHEDAIRHIDTHLVNLMHMRETLEDSCSNINYEISSTQCLSRSDRDNISERVFSSNEIERPQLCACVDAQSDETGIAQAKIALAISGYTEDEIDTIATVAAAKIRYARELDEEQKNTQENCNDSYQGLDDTARASREHIDNIETEWHIRQGDTSEYKSVSDVLSGGISLKDELDALDDESINNRNNDKTVASIHDKHNKQADSKNDLDEIWSPERSGEKLDSTRVRIASTSTENFTPDEHRLADGVTETARTAAAQAIENSRTQVDADCMPMMFGNEGISKSVRDTMNRVAEIINDDEISSMLGDEKKFVNNTAKNDSSDMLSDLFDDLSGGNEQEDNSLSGNKTGSFNCFSDSDEIDNAFDQLMNNYGNIDNETTANTGDSKRTKEEAERIARAAICSMESVPKKRRTAKRVAARRLNESEIGSGALIRAEQRMNNDGMCSLEQKRSVADKIASSLLISKEVSKFLNETYDIPESEMSDLYASYSELFGDEDTGYKVPSFATESKNEKLVTTAPVPGMLDDNGTPLKQSKKETAETLEDIGISVDNLPQTGLLAIPSNTAGLSTYKAPLESVAIDVTDIGSSSMLIECRDAEIIEWDLGGVLTESNIDIAAFWLNGINEQNKTKCIVDWKRNGWLTVETIGETTGILTALRGDDLFNDYAPIRTKKTQRGTAEYVQARTALEAVSNLPEMDVSSATLGIRFAGVIFMAHFFAGSSDIEVSWKQPENAKDGLITGFFSDLAESITDYGCFNGKRKPAKHKTQAAWYADHAAAYDFIFIGRETEPFNKRLKQLGIDTNGEILARVIEPARVRKRGTKR